MKEFTNETYYVDEGDNDSPGEGGPSVDFLFSVAVAAYILGGMVGSLLGGFVADKFGRQRGLLYVQVSVQMSVCCNPLIRSYALCGQNSFSSLSLALRIFKLLEHNGGCCLILFLNF